MSAGGAAAGGGAAAAAAPAASSSFKFLFPEKAYMKEAERRAREEVAADAKENAAKEARKMRNEVAEALLLDRSCVECAAFSMFLSNRQQQVRCFLVKVEHDAPLPAGACDLRLRLQNIGFRMVNPHLCAMQILLNKNVSFPEAASRSDVQFDQIGKAFIEIVKPEKFNQLKCHTHAPGYSLIQVLTAVLRNVFAHMREQDFRVTVTTGGGILDATKLWLQEDAAEPHDSLNLGFWRAFDVAEYIFHGSLFGCVFPLCYRLIRTKLRSDHVLPPRYKEMLLQCMPAAHFDFEIPSSLDWYVHASLCITVLKSCAQVLRPRG